MQIFLNGEAHQTSAITVADLIAELALTGKRVAVEINGDIAPRSQHTTLSLNPNDRVEVVHAIGGG